MSDEIKEEMEQNFVEIYGDDGNIIKCEVYDIIDFEDKTYVLLLPLTENEDNDDAEVVVMEYIEEGEEAYYQDIEPEQFKKVCAYIQSLDDEDEEE